MCKLHILVDRHVNSKLRRVGTVLGSRLATTGGTLEFTQRMRTSIDTLSARIVQEVAAFRASRNPDVLPELVEHIEAYVLGAVRGIERDDYGFDYVRRHAERRADQRFPLDALLQAYRCGQRVLGHDVATALLGARASNRADKIVTNAASDYAMLYSDAVTGVAADAYVMQTRRVAEAEGNERTELLNTLLGGYDEADGRAAQLLRRSGYLEQRQSFCVVAARSVDPREMQNPARAQRMVDALALPLRDTPFRSLFGLREGLAISVVSGARRASGWTAPRSLLADRLLPKLTQVGPAALIGISTDAPSTGHLRRAHDEAKLALDFATVSRRVVSFPQIPVREMIVRQASVNRHGALPAWLKPLQAADRKARGRLVETLRAYADADMNVLKTRTTLRVHANTIYARMHKVTRVTGKNPLKYHDLTDLLLGIDCAEKLA